VIRVALSGGVRVKSRLFVVLVVLAAVASMGLPGSSPALAQPTAPAPAPAPPADPAAQIVSPEVAADGKVTFRLYAPQAHEVAVAGEWTRPQAPPNTPQKLSKDAHGVWSVTLGPLDPSIYIYVFQVDGMTITDPVNPSIKLRARTSASMVEVPGGAPWEFRDVPHGAITLETHAAHTLGGAMRQIAVYTPPGYDKDRGARYPVVYLLHGNNDLALGWTMAGRANLVLDNLIADKKARPMILVMPWGHALPFGSKPAAGQPSNNDVFERYLMDEVAPLVEGKYRITAGRQARAVVGLSMGGAQAMQLWLDHGDRFGAVGVFGAGMPRADLEARDKASASAKKPTPGLFYLGIGLEDPGLPRARELSGVLRGRGLPVVYNEVTGGHTYPVWRKLLVDLAPRLFQK
jgi:enterochelin esterase-like enzyme